MSVGPYPKGYSVKRLPTANRIEELKKSRLSWREIARKLLAKTRKLEAKLQFAENRIQSALDADVAIQKENAEYWEAVLKQLRGSNGSAG